MGERISPCREMEFCFLEARLWDALSCLSTEMRTVQPPQMVSDFPSHAHWISFIFTGPAQNPPVTTARDVQDSPALSTGGTWNQTTFTLNDASKRVSPHLLDRSFSATYLLSLPSVPESIWSSGPGTFLAFDISGQCTIPMHPPPVFRPTSSFPKDFQFLLF